MKKINIFLAFLLLTSSFTGCKKVSLDGWEPHILTPFVKGIAKIEDVSDLRDKEFTQDIPPFDIGVTPFVPVNLQGLSIDHVGPYEHDISEYFKYVLVDSANLTIGFLNNFPVKILKGTKIVFRSSTDLQDNNNIIYSHTLSEDLHPYEMVEIHALLINKYVTDVIYLYLENFNTASGNNLYFTDQPTQLTFEIKFLSISQIGIKTNREYAFADTAEIEIEENTDSYNDSTAIGQLNIFLENSIPVNVDFTPYFVDENFNVIDSLYDGDLTITGGIVNPVGDPVSVEENKFSVILSPERVRNLKRAKFLIYKFSANTFGYPGEVVVGSKKCTFSVQIAGDLKIKVEKLVNL